jgi:hypothetical protein
MYGKIWSVAQRASDGMGKRAFDTLSTATKTDKQTILKNGDLIQVESSPLRLPK